jgi:flagellar basal body-associated protein FliL
MMADEELRDGGGQEEKEGASGPMISSKGWLIVAALVLCEAVAFGIILWFERSDSKEETQQTRARETIAAAEVNKYRVRLDDLNYTINSPSQMATLSMAMDLILGQTEEERSDPQQEVPSPALMNEYVDVVAKLEPEIRDEIQTIVDNMSVQQMLKPEGKELIKTRIREYVNDRLENIIFQNEGDGNERGKRRLNTVALSQFILQR